MGLEKNKTKTDEKEENEVVLNSTPAKPKRVMSDAQKIALAKGREKAHERMRGLKTEKEELKSFKQPIKSVEEEEENHEDLKQVKEKPKVTKLKHTKKVVEVEENDDDDVSEEDEKPIVKVSQGKRVIEKHYYHAPKEQLPPPPPIPQPIKPKEVIKEKPKIKFK